MLTLDKSSFYPIKRAGKVLSIFAGIMTIVFFPAWAGSVHAENSELERIIVKALDHSPELAALRSKTGASRHRIPQAGSLPDPMFMVGYQNMGTRAYTYGDEDSQWMFTASQMFPYPGKLALKTEMAEKESESLKYETEMAEINLIQKIRETYVDIALAGKELEIISAKKILYEKIEETSLARYSSGMGMQQDALMAQTEKYMLIESGEMIKAGILSKKAMFAGFTGYFEAKDNFNPVFPSMTKFTLSMEDAIKKADAGNPEILAKMKMSEASKSRADMAKREFYPDFTISAGYGLKGGDYDDMVNVSATANIPIFYKSKQSEGVYEAKKLLDQSRHEVEEARVMTASRIRENYAMLKSSENLSKLYLNAIIPKNRQDFDLSLASFSTGRTEASVVIEKLKKLRDSETAYWKNLAEREKSITRIEALAGVAAPSRYIKSKGASKN